jgi:hypothetical protein
MAFDNADELEALRTFWPPPAPKGFILITTRDRAAGRSPAESGIEVLPLTIEDATKVFFSLLDLQAPDEASATAQDDAELETARRLVSELGTLPLAISQAAGYIARTGCTISDYLSMYLGRGNQLELLESSRDVNYFYEKTVASTWTSRYFGSKEHEPNAAQLLRILAFLDPDGVPGLLLINGSAAFQTDESGPHFLQDRTQCNNAIGTLAQCSLISRQNETLFMHRIVQKVTLNKTTSCEPSKLPRH